MNCRTRARTHVIYAANIDAANDVGYDAKILGQAIGLSQNGLTCDVLVLRRDAGVMRRHINENGVSESQTVPFTMASNRLGQRLALLRATIALARTTAADAVYLRYPRCDPFLLLALIKLRRACPEIRILSEYPTFPYDNEVNLDRSTRGVAIKWVDRLSRPFLRFLVWRAVPVIYDGPVFGMPSITIQNGITVDDFPVCANQPSHESGDPLILLAVGNVMPWHGYDRLICGMGEYQRECGDQRACINVHIVGAAGIHAEKLALLAKTLQVSEYVRISPPMHGRELDSIYAKASLAIDSLGIHRIGLSTVCSLKAREYCARAIPFVSSHDDPDFPNTLPFVFHCPADDSPIPLDRLLTFADHMKHNPHNKQAMRDYAVTNLDWKIKMAPVAKCLL
jgi:hypothetical protein